jgi:hypothetical protein
MKKFSLSEGKELIKIARKSINYFFASGKVMKELAPEKFSEKKGVFVTLHEFPSKELRGCIGFPHGRMPLWNAVIEASVAAAFSDPRFPALTLKEMQKIIIEVSVLSTPKEIKEKKSLVEKIRVGKDGLIIKTETNSGLLLPQVAKEWNWNAKEFLENTCIKAGLPKETWKKEECKIFKFQAQIFCEEKPEGKIKEISTLED